MTTTVRCACGALLTVRTPRRVTFLGLWCGHLDVIDTTKNYLTCTGRKEA